MEQVKKSESRVFSVKIYWKEVLAVLIILLAIYFFRSQVGEIKTIIPRILNANINWVLPGCIGTLLFVLLQAMMYVAIFRSVGIHITLLDAVELYLKRNVLSVFLPAGAIASLAYTPHRLKKKRVNSAQGLKASLLFGYIAILTVFIVGVPVIAYTLIGKQNINNSWLWLLVLGLLLAVMVLVVVSFIRKGFVYRLAVMVSPSFAEKIEGLLSEKIEKKSLALAVIYSCFIEVVSIVMVYVSVRAMGYSVKMEVAAIGYIVSVIPMMISPFLRGLGAVELTLAYVLSNFGYDSTTAMGTTLLYRIFQFWLPLILGLFAFLWKGKELIGRTLPAAGMLVLGIANILSVLNIPLAERLQWSISFLPIESLPVSRAMMLFVSIVMLLVSANLMRGHRNAFILAVGLTLFSVVWQLTRTINVPESIIAFSLLVLLVVYRKEYRVKSDRKWLGFGFRAFYLVFFAVLLFDVIGFLLLEKRHFGVEFTFMQSVEYTLRSFFLMDNDLVPTSGFAKEFLTLVHFLAFTVWVLLVFTLFKTRKIRFANTHEWRPMAERLIRERGNSSLDSYKLGKDKDLFIPAEVPAFMGYKVAKGMAVVLEGPVCEKSKVVDAIGLFEEYCLENGWKTCYFMVGDDLLDDYSTFNKKKMLLGQEALLDVDVYKQKIQVALPNTLAISVECCGDAHSKIVLEELRTVSDEWLAGTKRKEVGFFTSVFDADALRHQDLIVARQLTDGKLVAFISVVSTNSASEECAMGLFRMGSKAPLGCDEALIDGLVNYAGLKGFQWVNLGIASSIGVIEPENMPERIQHYISNTFKSLRDFQSQREFMDKYATRWSNRYLLYDSDYDLFLIPVALKRVIRPSLTL